MMGTAVDLSGQRFGAWLVIEQAVAPAGYERLTWWLCRCDCGETAIRKGAQLRWAQGKGVHQSCEQCARTRHGRSKTSEYAIWANMKHRCRNPSHRAFPHYGGRGIDFCERWDSFDNFLADMGERPSEKHSLDRKDNEKGYTPDNCRWTTWKVQNRNRRGVTPPITHNGKTLTIAEWAEETGLGVEVLRQRLKTWSVEDALDLPAGVRRDAYKPGVKAKAYTVGAKTQTLKQWAAELGIPYATLMTRLHRGAALDSMVR